MANETPQATSVERTYAHFHRVLAELLETLVADSAVTWLDTPGHTLTGDYEKNVYNPAVYVVPSLDPYREALTELEEVQTEALELTGRTRPGRNLLPPLTAENVTHVRISKYEGQTGRTISREAGVARLKQLEDSVTASLLEFEQYATEKDPARRKVETELRALRKSIRTLEQSKAGELRETYQQTVIRPYVYRADDTSEQLHMRSAGLIAAGPSVSVSWREGPRRTRSDKVQIEPIVQAGAFRFYDLEKWNAARGL